jgi:hypothetical protein
MNGFEIIATVLAVFYAVGIAVGMLVVVALPPLRNRRMRMDGSNSWQLPPRDDDDRRPPHWPGSLEDPHKLG